MCDSDHAHEHYEFGSLVDAPEIRTLIEEAQRQMCGDADVAERVEALKGSFAWLLSADGWHPERFAQPDGTSRMGGGMEPMRRVHIFSRTTRRACGGTRSILRLESLRRSVRVRECAMRGVAAGVMPCATFA